MKGIKQETLIKAIELFIDICAEMDAEKKCKMISEKFKNNPEIPRIAVEVAYFAMKVNSGQIKRFYYFFNHDHELHGYYQLVFARNVIEAGKRMKLVYGEEWKNFCIERDLNLGKPIDAIRECKLDPIYVFENSI